MREYLDILEHWLYAHEYVSVVDENENLRIMISMLRWFILLIFISCISLGILGGISLLFH